MLNIGIISPSNIAFNRFLPSLMKSRELKYVGVAVADAGEWEGTASAEIVAAEQRKAEKFRESFGGEVFSSYRALLENPGVQAIYMPLPPALHYKWGKNALEAGKHLLMEKPFTTSLKDTQTLLKLAGEANLAVHENYMFQYHGQLAWMEEQISSGAIGELRIIRAAFGFPFRGSDDFRYNKALGGGALLDCGGYPVRLAQKLLGEGTEVVTSQLSGGLGLEVDLFGSATLRNPAGQIAQITFGMDNSYKCELELWGSTGCILAERVFTAPDGFKPPVRIKTKEGERLIELPADDAFLNSISLFYNSITSKETRQKNRAAILSQSKTIQRIMEG